MPPLEPRDHRSSVPEAIQHVRRHRAANTGRVEEGANAGAFHAKQVLELLAQPGCVGLRIYYGRSDKGGRTVVLVGIDAEGKDMAAESNLLMEEVWPCPPYCDTSSPLYG